MYEPDGPAFDLEVVGIVRDPGDLERPRVGPHHHVPHPAFREALPTDVVGVAERGHA